MNKKASRKVTELKNPRDVTIDEERTHALGVTLNTTHEAFESTKRKRDQDDDTNAQHAVAIQLRWH